MHRNDQFLSKLKRVDSQTIRWKFLSQTVSPVRIYTICCVGFHKSLKLNTYLWRTAVIILYGKPSRMEKKIFAKITWIRYWSGRQWLRMNMEVGVAERKFLHSLIYGYIRYIFAIKPALVGRCLFRILWGDTYIIAVLLLWLLFLHILFSTDSCDASDYYLYNYYNHH